VQQDNHGTIGGPGLGITDIEDAGLDLFQYGKRGVGARPRARLAVAGLRKQGSADDERRRRKRRGEGSKDVAAVRLGRLRHQSHPDYI